jgi:hypothetical protein
MCLVLIAASGGAAFSQQAGSVIIEDKVITIQYSAPSVKGRKIFGGVIPYNQVWRIGENTAATFHTGADLVFEGLSVPKGDYSLYLLPKDGEKWLLVINKQTGQKALNYDPKMDVGRVPMTMSKPPAAVETCKLTLTKTAVLAAKVDLAWENTVATARFHLDRVLGDSEW